MLIFITFISILFISISILIGLNLSKNITDTTMFTIFWFSYIVTLFAIFNVVLVSYFWKSLQKKTGPPGPRGLKGDLGDTGLKGDCGETCRTKQCTKDILDSINEVYKELKNDNNAKINNEFILTKVKQMCHSKEYEVMAPIKGPNNLHEYMINIWKDWIKLIYRNNGNTFLSSKFSDINRYSWTNANPVREMEKYDIFHWGLSRLFKGLGIGVCQFVNKNNYFPKYDKLPYKVIETNCYESPVAIIDNDYGLERSSKLAIFTPKKIVYQNEVYYPITQIAVSNYTDAQLNQDIRQKFYKSGNTMISNYSTVMAKFTNYNSNTLRVVVFNQNNFRGTTKRFRIGKYARLEDFNFHNQLRSLTIPNGITVNLYTQNNFRGSKKTLLGSQQSRVNSIDNFNGRINSIEISFSDLGEGPSRISLLATGDIIKKPIDYQPIWNNAFEKGVIFGLDKLIHCKEPRYIKEFNQLGHFTCERGAARHIPDNDISGFVIADGYKISLFEHYGNGWTLKVVGPKVFDFDPNGVGHDWATSFTLEQEGEFKELSIWRPVPPPGYVCVSDVFVRGYNKPSINDPVIMCIKEEYAQQHNIPIQPINMPSVAGRVWEYRHFEKHKGWELPIFAHLGTYSVGHYWDPEFPLLHDNIPHDDIDAIEVYPNFKITLYEHSPNHGGVVKEFGPGLEPDLTDDGLLNKVTTMKIEYSAGRQNVDNKDPNIIFKSLYEQTFKDQACGIYNKYLRQSQNKIFTLLGYISSHNGVANSDNLFGGFRVEKNDVTTFYNRSTNIPTSGSFYKLNIFGEQVEIYEPRNTDPLKSQDNPLKTKDPLSTDMYSELGIGWHGDPVRDPKYSIFTYLNMMPEGIVTHRATERKYYITHSGIIKLEENMVDGQKIKQSVPENSYLILKYNPDLERYDLALSCNENNDNIRILEGSKQDIRQLWEVEFLSETNNNEFRFKSKMTNKYLHVDPRPSLRGRSHEIQTVHKGVDSNPDEKTIFHNHKSAYGPSLNITRFRGYKEKENVTKNNQTPDRFIKGIYDPKVQ